MQIIRILETRNGIHCYGYISTYERTEAERQERKQKFKQKAIGIIALIISLMSLQFINILPEFGIFAIMMSLIGIMLLLVKDQII